MSQRQAKLVSDMCQISNKMQRIVYEMLKCRVRNTQGTVEKTTLLKNSSSKLLLLAFMVVLEYCSDLSIIETKFCRK